jgi:hypothetical protein
LIKAFNLAGGEIPVEGGEVIAGLRLLVLT